jgi:hypothetical protein
MPNRVGNPQTIILSMSIDNKAGKIRIESEVVDLLYPNVKVARWHVIAIHWSVVGSIGTLTL